MLSAGDGRLGDANSGARALGHFRIARASGNSFAGPAGVLHDGFNRARRCAVRILQQYTNFPAPSSRFESSGARERRFGAIGHQPSFGAAAAANVLWGSETHADCTSAGAPAGDAAV